MALAWPHETAAISASSVYTIQPCTVSLHAKPHTGHLCTLAMTSASPMSCHHHSDLTHVLSPSLWPHPCPVTITLVQCTFLSLSLRVSHVPDIFTSSSLAITFIWLTLSLLLPFNPCPATLITAFLCNGTITCARHSFLGLILPNTISFPHPCAVFFHPSWSTGSFTPVLLPHFVHDVDVSWIQWYYHSFIMIQSEMLVLQMSRLNTILAMVLAPLTLPFPQTKTRTTFSILFTSVVWLWMMLTSLVRCITTNQTLGKSDSCVVAFLLLCLKHSGFRYHTNNYLQRFHMLNAVGTKCTWMAMINFLHHFYIVTC